MVEARNGDAKDSSSKKYEINLETFGKRVKLLYACWKDYKKEHWGGADAIVIVKPPPLEDLCYLKSYALHTRLLGYKFPETIMVFLQEQIHVLCNHKKAMLLEEFQKSSKKQFGLDVVVHAKAREDDGSGLMESNCGWQEILICRGRVAFERSSKRGFNGE